LLIASDGGLNDEEMKYLWGPDFMSKLSRCWAALQMAVCIIGNVGYLIYLDITVLSRSQDDTSSSASIPQERFLFGRRLWDAILGSVGQQLSGEQVVVLVELASLVGLFLVCAFTALRGVLSWHACERWRSVSVLFWRLLPMVATFTAMKLLFFVDPWVILTELSFEWTALKARFSHGHRFLAIFGMFRYIISRMLCFLVGFDSFLIKFRETSDNYINKEEFSMGIMFGSVAFLFQVLGVVNVTFIVRTRLFYFIFGGADCAVNCRDKAKEWLWNAMLARKIRESHPFTRFVIIMLSFTDYDIQHLLLSVKKGFVRQLSPGDFNNDSTTPPPLSTFTNLANAQIQNIANAIPEVNPNIRNSIPEVPFGRSTSTHLSPMD